MKSRTRLLAIAALTALATLGVPGQAGAQWVPRTLGGTLKVAPVVQARLERTIVLPWRANSIGFSFADRRASNFSLVVRARTASGWDQWTELEAADNGPDQGVTDRLATARTVTEPIWVGSADAIELKLATTAALHDLRLHLINSLGDARPPTLLERVGRTLRSFLTMQPARAMTSTPGIIPRAGWGANESWRRAAPSFVSAVKMVFIHHTDNSNSYSRSQSAALVRSIYHYHVYTNGWNDIGYNFLIDRYGQIFEGRYGGTMQAVIGAHTLGFNTYSSGISLIGNFSSVRPTSAMLRSLAYLTAWKMDVHHIPALGRVEMLSYGNPRYARGRVVTFNRISGHRDAYPTACPGSAGYGRLPWLRSAVTGLGNPKIFVPRWTVGERIRPDGDGVDDANRFVAGFSATVTWTLSIRNASGGVVKSFTGAGTSVSAVWTFPAGASIPPTGRYTWQIAATDGAGKAARPATGTLSIVGTHPDGTLLRDSNGQYLLANGTAQRLDQTYFSSNFGEILPVVRTGPGERSRYAAAATSPVLRAGTILTNTSVSPATYHIWDGAVLHQFGTTTDPNTGDSIDTFSALGYNPAAAIGVSADVLATMPAGQPVTDVTTHPTGTLIRKSNGTLFVVLPSGGIQPIGTLAKRSLYRSAELVNATSGEELVQPAPGLVAISPRDGTLVRAPNGGRWMFSGGQWRAFRDAGIFDAMGYVVSYLLPATDADLAAYPAGSVIG